MRKAGIRGVSGRSNYRRLPHAPSADDHVQRDFNRDGPNQLWVTDITEHRTREGKVYCAVVLDAFSRRVVGWAIDSGATAALTTNALAMAIEQPTPPQGAIVPSMGAVGHCYDNAMIESFWSRMQVELLDRQRWKTRLELTNAIFDYLEIFHNRKRRHSALGLLTPVDFEARHEETTAA